jgi:pterin-4a-carbinolamine dehydratase
VRRQAIVKDFKFADFHHTLGFINAVGFMANHEDHHPDIEAGYGHCQLLWSTHDVGGLSLNDFICAARVEACWRAEARRSEIGARLFLAVQKPLALHGKHIEEILQIIRHRRGETV